MPLAHQCPSSGRREHVKEIYPLLKSVTLKLVHVFIHIYWLEIRKVQECGLAQVPNYNPIEWKSGILSTLQSLTLQIFAVSVASSMSSIPPYLRLILFQPVGNILLFLGLVILWRKSVPWRVTWVFCEIKLHILSNSPPLCRTHRCPYRGGWFTVTFHFTY